MSELGTQPSLPNPLGPIEANVTIAGLQGVAVAWFGYYALTGQVFLVAFTDEWHWYYAAYVLFSLIGLMIAGLATEGLAEIFERAATRRWWGQSPGKLWDWYSKAVQLPPTWGPGQRWMWKSEQASREFARRRLRLLVCRNTAACCFITAILAAVGVVRSGIAHASVFWFALGGALAATLLFVFLWLDAHRGWNKAVADAGEIGPP